MRPLRAAVFVVAVSVAAGLSLAAEVSQQGIDAVAAGDIKEAKASWWGYDPVDATDCLQAAIDSGVPRLIVDDVGSPYRGDTITRTVDGASWSLQELVEPTNEHMQTWTVEPV